MKLFIRNIFIFFVSLAVSGQVPQAQFQTLEPVSINHAENQVPITPYYYNSTLNTLKYNPSNPNAYTVGSTNAEGIIQQQNITAMKMMGYTAPVVPPSDPSLRHQFIISQYNQSTAKEQFQQQKELMDILNDIHRNEPMVDEYWKAPGFATKEKPYYDALNNIRQQLIGINPLTIAEAYYEIENAEGNAMLSKKEFKDEIKRTASFALQWMLENKLDPKNNLAVHFAIQKLFSDTLIIGLKQIPEMPHVPLQKHLPFYYDYEDYKAEKDNRSYHVSKGFATGNGQCHILPLMYGCIAEAMGTEFYLSYAPFHSFIKYPDNKGNIHSYEVTTNWQISDQWYKDNLGVTSIGEKNKIYLHPMNRKEIVASAMMDLAFSYRKNNGIADGKFISECIDFAMNYFPNKEANIYGWLMRSKLTAVELDRLLTKKGIKDLKEAHQIPEAQQLFAKLSSINKKIESLGYSEVSIEAYDQMIEDSRKRHSEIPQKNNLQKRESFTLIKSN